MYTACDCEHLPLIQLTGYQDILDSFLDDVHSGKITADTIDADYYNNLATKLSSAVFDGLTADGGAVNGKSFAASDSRNTLKAFFDQNVYAFSGAKSLTVAQQYNALLLDENGEVRSRPAFRAAVLQIDAAYNKRYLDAEQDMAIASAQMAQLWQGLQSFDALQYRSSGGENVCPICGGFDNMILATNDPLWATIYPQNHPFCHCTVVPAGAGDALTNPQAAINATKAANIQPYFKNNVGQTRVIYKDDHPYFQNIPSGKISELDAVKNYGMQSGEKIYATADLPDFEPLKGKEAADTWWQNMVADKSGEFTLVAKDDLTVNFDEAFRNKLLNLKDGRYQFLNQLKEVLQNPDEVWSNKIWDKKKAVLQNTYIKYYKNFPIVLGVETVNDVRAITMYELEKNGKLDFKSLTNARKGVLIYQKLLKRCRRPEQPRL